MTLADAIVAQTEVRRRDPLIHYRCASRQAEWIYGHIHEADIYNPAANKFGKSTLGAALDIAFCRGMSRLGGVPIPVISAPVAGAIGTPSYKLGQGSVLEALYGLLGNYPHHEERVSGGTSIIYIRHRMNRDDDYRTWSKVYVFPYEGPVPEAVRLDFWHADEPPPVRWLDAIRNRGKRGRKLHGLITATPIDKREWEPIKAQYPDALEQIVNGRATVRGSVYDNRFLTPADIAEAEQVNQSSPWKRARLLGEHVDASGKCPFDPENKGLLEPWLDLTRDPDLVELVEVTRNEQTRTAITPVKVSVRFELWAFDGKSFYDPDEEYVCIFDPATGINDPEHDPDGMHVYARRRKALVCRVNQYLGGTGIAEAAYQASEAFGGCPIDPLNTGGYAGEAIARLSQLGFRRWWVDPTETTRRHKLQERIGHAETAHSRPRAIGAVQAAIQSGSMIWPSRAVIQCFKDCVVDSAGKVVASDYSHDEDLVLAGRGAYICENFAEHLPAKPGPRISTSADVFVSEINRMFGRDVMNGHPIRGPLDVDGGAKWR